jgi:hypothetical protein
MVSDGKQPIARVPAFRAPRSGAYRPPVYATMTRAGDDVGLHVGGVLVVVDEQDFHAWAFWI